VTAVAVLVSAVAVILVQRGPEPASAAGAPQVCGTIPTHATRELRGMTLTTVRNTDWPSRPGLSPDAAKAEFIAWLDLAVAQHHNAIFVQVKPSGDAFWDSEYAPWSEWLTGNRADVGPGWDPMEFMVSEAHKRNIEFHAWVMPYFGGSTEGAGGDINKLPPGHALREHPEWAVVFPDNSSLRLWYNPGIPEARRYIEDSILEAVTRYDVDGIFFDDYFYPYPRTGQVFDDAAAYARYGDGMSLADWRRSNVNTLVQELSARIKEAKPWVKFGISPFGIWRNLKEDPDNGSDTQGLSAYDAIYADSRHWVREQWVDFIMPQLYWYIGNYPTADYKVLVPWWSKQIEGTRVQLYTAHGDHNIGRSGAWSDPAEISDQLTLNEEYPVSGSVHFTAKYVRDDPLGAVTLYRDQHYAAPALPPAMPQLPVARPGAPIITRSTVDSGAVTLHWRPARGEPAVAYGVYRYGPSDTTAELVAVVHSPGTSFTDTPPDDGPYAYCVSGLDRSWNEGPTSDASLAD
jgi:uncharacterized lipoprotein YddW (UPF0748 family)